MKTKTNLSILSLLGIFFFISIFSCSSEDINENKENSNQSEIAEILNIGENFGKMHSEGLAFILNELQKSAETRVSGYDRIGYILQATNKFIQTKNDIKTRIVYGEEMDRFSQSYVISPTLTLNKETYQQITINDMKKQMTADELYYINYVENNINKLIIGSNFYNLILQASRDPRLSRAQKESIICFISTAEDSYKYWKDNAVEWEKLQPINTPPSMRISYRWRSILFADAFWGWTGMIGSGLNPIVGGGAAAAGSAISALN